MTYSNYSNIVASGTIESAKQGKMVGLVSELPAAADCNGCAVMLGGTMYRSNGETWEEVAVKGEVETDPALDPTSDNAPSNKAVTAALALKLDKTALYTTPGYDAQDPLTTRNFVNSSVATNTANYISNNGQPFASLAQLEMYTGTVTNNDYAFVTGVDGDGNTFYDRYKATVNGASKTWAKEYRLNNSSFTAAQWAAISSGITSTKIEAYDAYSAQIDAKQDKLTPGTGIQMANGLISLTNTGVSSGTVGSATAVPVISVDPQGRITAKSTAEIFPPTTAGISGQLWQSDGSGTGVWQTLDAEPMENSRVAVTSGGVASAIASAKSQLNNQLSTVAGQLSSQIDTASAELSAQIATKQNIISSVAVTVPIAGGTVSVPGMTADALVWVSPAPSSFDVYTAAGCRCTAQDTDSLTFSVTKDATEAMTVNIAWAV